MKSITMVTLFVLVVLILSIGLQFKSTYQDGYEAGYYSWIKINADFNSRLNQAMRKYGSLHDTPWDYFTIEDKMWLCIFGSSGNKLSSKDIDEIIFKYGGK